MHCTVLVDKHPIGIILKSNTVKGIRFSIKKVHWAGTAAHARLPEVVIGEIQAWGGRSKEDNKIHVEWETDGRNSDEYLAVLLRPTNDFTLLPYTNNKSAPKAKGAGAKRAYAVAITNGPYARAERVAEREKVEVSLLILMTPHRLHST